MAEKLKNDGGQTDAPPRRPLWLAAPGALLMAVFAALIGLTGGAVAGAVQREPRR